LDFDVCIVGAGAIGLASARAFALAGRSVVVLEAEARFGSGTSSRNSEVVHAGLYYPTGSLKARFCVEGRRRLYAYCVERGVEARKIGKLVVATEPEELPILERLEAQGEANGVEGLRRLDAREATAIEPALRCVGALHSPETGIFDAQGYMRAVLGDLEDAGGALALQTPFVRAELSPEGVRIEAGGAEPTRLEARIIVNATGLAASDVARSIAGVDPASVPDTRFAKGNYFSLIGRAPFSRLIYPAPVAHGLGVHLTFDLAGGARFGPDVEWIDKPDYAVDPARADAFARAIGRYWPGVPTEALQPAYAGVRPKISGPNEPAADFRIDVVARGDARVLSLFGIESPGLTASLALADAVVAAAR
jgi:L-2-hydroxyglutarate oxidase LhgO